MAGLPSLLLLLCVATLSLANLDDNCMVRRLEQSGIKRGKAVAYGKNLVRAGFSEKFLTTTPAPIASYIMKGTVGEAIALQKCIVGVLKACKDSSPCHNGGKCLLRRSRRDYVCKCPKDYTSAYCLTPHPAPVGEFRALQKIVVGQGKLLATQGKQLSATRAVLRRVRKFRGGKVPVCPTSSLLGYKYTSRHTMNFGSKNGKVMSLRFRKKLPDTLLRMSFSSNVGMHSKSHSARWFFRIDGQECSNPTKLDIVLYQGFANKWILTPSVLKGICKGTSRGKIGKGFHTITVHTGKEISHGHGSSHSGWQSTSFLEVQEVCPPF